MWGYENVSEQKYTKREAQELKQREKKKIPWHIIEGHFGAKLLIDKSTNLPGRR